MANTNKMRKRDEALDFEFRAVLGAESSQERLSASARAGIRQGIVSAGDGAVHAPLFAPLGRLLAAGALPVLLLGLLAVSLIGPAWSPDQELPPRISAEKSGGHVIFYIANGGRSHQIYRSSDPASFGPSSSFGEARTVFHDRLGNDGDVVFYRID